MVKVKASRKKSGIRGKRVRSKVRGKSVRSKSSNPNYLNWKLNNIGVPVEKRLPPYARPPRRRSSKSTKLYTAQKQAPKSKAYVGKSKKSNNTQTPTQRRLAQQRMEHQTQAQRRLNRMNEQRSAYDRGQFAKTQAGMDDAAAEREAYIESLQ